MRSRINKIIVDYTKTKELDVESLYALKALNYLLAIQSAVIGFFFWGPNVYFLRPISPPDSAWLSMSMFGIEIWDILFPIGVFLIVFSTALLKRVKFSHAYMAVVWGSLGMLWSIAGLIDAPSHLFGVGILSIFLSALHISVIRLWDAEGVE